MEQASRLLGDELRLNVAVLTVLARDWLVVILARHSAPLDRLGRGLDFMAGVILVLIGVRELIRRAHPR